MSVNLKRKAPEEEEEKPLKRVASTSGQDGSDGEDSDDGLQVKHHEHARFDIY
jgi:hypothetical protein